jgi:hypothetical protein
MRVRARTRAYVQKPLRKRIPGAWDPRDIFAQLRLTGSRFEADGTPVEAVTDLVAYQDLVAGGQGKSFALSILHGSGYGEDSQTVSSSGWCQLSKAAPSWYWSV